MTAYEAYGLGIDGLPAALKYLMPEAGGPEAEPLRHRLVISFSAEPLPEERFDSDSRVLNMGGTAGWVLDRRARTATFHGQEVPPDVIAHPLLGAAAVTTNRWLGREAFHAGAAVIGGRAWLVIGQREAGKSSLIAQLAAVGHPILADDVVITDGTAAFAGPRSVDLRSPVPGLDLPLEPSRWSTRSWFLLPPVASAVPIGGWVFLGWSDLVNIERIPTGDLLSLVTRARMLPLLHSDPAAMLNLGTLPGFVFERPKDWAQLGSSTDVLVAALESADNPAGH